MAVTPETGMRQLHIEGGGLVQGVTKLITIFSFLGSERFSKVCWKKIRHAKKNLFFIIFDNFFLVLVLGQKSLNFLDRS